MKRFLQYRADLLPFVLFLVIGTLLAYYAMLFSNFSLMTGSSGDNRLIHYVLEHSYLWMRGVNPDFWSPPMFFPAENTAAYTDILLGTAPFYWLWRVLRIDMDTSFQFWMITISTLNYIVSYVFLRRTFNVGPLAAAAGAFIFTFSSPRLNKMMHMQLLCHFYTLIALYALLAYFKNEQRLTQRNWIWIPVFCLGVIGQLYAGYYFGWFLIIILMISTAWSLLVPRFRAALIYTLRGRMLVMYPAIVFSVLLLAPMIIPYLSAASGLETRDFTRNALSMVPRPQSWLYMSANNWLYGSYMTQAPFTDIPIEWEHRLGLGIVTPLMALFGVFVARRNRFVRLMVVVSCTLFMFATLWGDFTVWRYVFNFIPGGSAVRAISRIGLLILIPASVGVSMFVDMIMRKHWLWRLLLIPMLVLLVAEQVTTTTNWEKSIYRAEVHKISKQIDPSCGAFFYTPFVEGTPEPWYQYHIDAMWAALETGIPTLNGYSGNQPPGITYRENIIVTSDEERQRLNQNMLDWLYKMGDVPPSTVCVITG